jgi:hypothetical protein
MLEFARWIELSIVVLLLSGEIKVELNGPSVGPVTLGSSLAPWARHCLRHWDKPNGAPNAPLAFPLGQWL